jgi:hypothetical protein
VTDAAIENLDLHVVLAGITALKVEWRERRRGALDCVSIGFHKLIWSPSVVIKCVLDSDLKTVNPGARPVGTEQAENLPGIDRKGECIHRRERAEAAGQVFDFENNVAHDPSGNCIFWTRRNEWGEHPMAFFRAPSKV